MLLIGAVPALAQTVCTEPAPPAAVDGTQVSADQLRAAMAQARDFIAQAGIYQTCLQQSGDADSGARIAASRKSQDRVGQSINAALDTYKRAHSN